jgi:hypothetical protein
MVRVPRGWQMHPPAGSAWNVPGPNVARIRPAPMNLYARMVTVDLGNDGIAPLATFTAGGTAQALCGPTSGGDVWSLDQCYLATSVGQLDIAQCTVYAGPGTVAQYGVASNLSGGGAQFGMGGVQVPFGWFVWALWTAGTPGATATLRVTGQKTVMSM